MTQSEPTPHPEPTPPPRLQLPTRLSDQVPGLAAYGLQPAGAPAAGLNGAIRTSDRDHQETRKVRTILASVGLLVVLVIAGVILAGSRSQPTPGERLAWNRAEIALLQRFLIKVHPQRYQAALHDPAAGNDPAKAVRILMVADLRAELDRLDRILNSDTGLSDGDLWNRTRQERLIAERALAWTDGYDRPFQVNAGGLKLSLLSLGANGRLDSPADLPRDDLSASVTMSNGEPMPVKMWDEVFTLPDMSQVQLFDPGNPKTVARLRAESPDHLTPRERQMEQRYKMLNMMDENEFSSELESRLHDSELKAGVGRLGEGVRTPPPVLPQTIPPPPTAPQPAQ